MSAKPDAPRVPKFGLDRLRILAGYYAGLRQRAVVCQVEVPDPAPYLAAFRLFRSALGPYLPPSPPCATLETGTNCSEAKTFLLELGELVGLLQIGAGIPVMDTPRVLSNPQVPGGYRLFLPNFAHKAAGEALAHIITLFQRYTRDMNNADWGEALDEVYDMLEPFAPAGSNPNQMMLIAADLDLPATRRVCGTFHFGWGSNGRMFRGGMSERTGTLAASAANDKRRTHVLLRAAGLPVAEQHSCKDLETARAHADAMGYPVVLKVTNMEAGVGVEANLPDAIALDAAWARLTSHNRPMVIERHMPGVIYRVNVVDGEVLHASCRTAATVTGDGSHSVAELVEIENQNPLRTDSRFAVMHPIRLTKDAETLLAHQGLTPESVPDAGRDVYLSVRTNRKDGGRSDPLTLDAIHPDNLRLAIRATDILRLDISGVDLLLPDAARSWRETGGTICEVNSNPNMSYTSRRVLETLLERIPNRGRIPVDVVLGANTATAQAVRDRLTDRPGIAVIEDGWLEITGDGRFDLPNAYAAAHAAILDSQVAGIVLLTNAQLLESNGLMLDRADRIWLLGSDQDAQMRVLLEPMTRDIRVVKTPDALLEGICGA